MLSQAITRKVRKYFRGKSFFFNDTFSTHTLLFKKTVWAIKFYYAMLLTMAVGTWADSWHRLYDSNFINPLWTLRILGWPNHQNAIIDATFIVFILGTFLSLIKTQLRIFRVLCFVGLIYYISLMNSDGLFFNSLHMALYPSFLFIFLPNHKNFLGHSRQNRHSIISYFWFSQFAVGLAYTLAGYYKVSEIYNCLAIDGLQQCEIGSQIMTSMAAKEKLDYQMPTFAGDILYNYPWFGAISYLGVIWFHLASLFFIFRFDLHGLFLCLRLIFHFGTLLLFGISFNYTYLIVFSLFAASPFYNPHVNLKTIINQLPGLSFLKSLFVGKIRYRFFNLFYSYIFVHLFLVFIYFPLTRDTDPFPLYNWRIFKPRPDKFMNYKQVLILQLDSKKLNPPEDLSKIKEQSFPNIDYYSWSGKLYELFELKRSLSNDPQNDNSNDRFRYLIDNIERELLQNHLFVEYEIWNYYINPIDYLKDGTILQKELVYSAKIGSKND